MTQHKVSTSRTRTLSYRVWERRVLWETGFVLCPLAPERLETVQRTERGDKGLDTTEVIHVLRAVLTWGVISSYRLALGSNALLFLTSTTLSEKIYRLPGITEVDRMFQLPSLPAYRTVRADVSSSLIWVLHCRTCDQSLNLVGHRLVYK